MVNLCRGHDLAHAQAEADEFCQEHGLTTRAAQREYRIERMRSFGGIKADPIAYWQSVLSTPNLPAISYAYANEALSALRRGKREVVEREPGEEG